VCLCVCGGRGGVRRRPDRKVWWGGRTILVEDRKVCVSLEGRGQFKIMIGPNSGGHVFKTVNHKKEVHLDS